MKVISFTKTFGGGQRDSFSVLRISEWLKTHRYAVWAYNFFSPPLLSMLRLLLQNLYLFLWKIRVNRVNIFLRKIQSGIIGDRHGAS